MPWVNNLGTTQNMVRLVAMTGTTKEAKKEREAKIGTTQVKIGTDQVKIGTDQGVQIDAREVLTEDTTVP